MKVLISALSDVEVIMAGPPCEPFCRNGVHFGFQDPRFGVFDKVISIIREMMSRGCLKLFLLENSSQIFKNRVEGKRICDVILAEILEGFNKAWKRMPIVLWDNWSFCPYDDRIYGYPDNEACSETLRIR